MLNYSALLEAVGFFAVLAMTCFGLVVVVALVHAGSKVLVRNGRLVVREEDEGRGRMGEVSEVGEVRMFEMDRSQLEAMVQAYAEDQERARMAREFEKAGKA